FSGDHPLGKSGFESHRRNRKLHLETSLILLIQRSRPYEMVGVEMLLPVSRRTALLQEAALEYQRSLADVPRERDVRAQRKITAPVSRRIEFEIGAPIDIPADLALDRTVGENTGFVLLRRFAREVIAQRELGVGVHVDADAAVDGR